MTKAFRHDGRSREYTKKYGDNYDAIFNKQSWWKRLINKIITKLIRNL